MITRHVQDMIILIISLERVANRKPKRCVDLTFDFDFIAFFKAFKTHLMPYLSFAMINNRIYFDVEIWLLIPRSDFLAFSFYVVRFIFALEKNITFVLIFNYYN